MGVEDAKATGEENVEQSGIQPVPKPNLPAVAQHQRRRHAGGGGAAVHEMLLPFCISRVKKPAFGQNVSEMIGRFIFWPYSPWIGTIIVRGWQARTACVSNVEDEDE